MNVILCLCDQLRAFSVGCYGDTVIRTPNIDALARAGVQFAVAVSNNPVCTSARSCLISGQYSRTCTGMLGNVHEDPPNARRVRFPGLTLPEVFRAAGYHTGLIGKWHIDPQPELLGFDEAIYPLISHQYYGQTYYESGKAPYRVETFTPEWELQRVKEFITRDRHSPFFLCYHISLPHSPIGVGNLPARYTRMYDREQVPLRPNTVQDGRLASSDFWFKIYTIWDYFWRKYPRELGDRASDRLPDHFDLPALIAQYYGAVTCVDDCVGQLMGMLEEQGIVEETLVVFLSDHGDLLGSHHLFNKDSLYEEAIRIPLLFHAPGLLAPRVNREQVAQLIDVLPTLVDLLALELPEGIQGQSLAAILRGTRTTLAKNYAIIETEGHPAAFSKLGGPHPCALGLRSPTSLYGIGFEETTRQILDEPRWYFDLTQDPYQLHNLAESEQATDAELPLLALLRSWDETTPWLDGFGTGAT